MFTFKQLIIAGSRLTFKNLKLVSLFWLTNFALSIALTLPVFTLLQDSLSHSVLSARLYESFDFLWFIQFVKIYEKSISVIPITIYSVIGIYILIQLFFTGGLLSLIVNSKKNHFVDFFYGGVKYFYRFLIIAFYTFIFYFLALGLNEIFNFLVKAVFQYSSNTLWEFLVQLIIYMFFLLMIGVVSIISDYSKVATVVTDNTRIFRTILKAIIFIKENFGKVILIFLVMFAFLAIGGIVYNLLDGLVPRSPVYFIVLNFIFQQLLIIFRVLIRMLVYSTEVVLYNDLNAELVESRIEEIL